MRAAPVQLHISRATIVTALTTPEYSFEVPAHTAECVVEENGEPQEVKADACPQDRVQNGKAEKVWVNLKTIKGPTSIKTSTLAGSDPAPTRSASSTGR